MHLKINTDMIYIRDNITETSLLYNTDLYNSDIQGLAKRLKRVLIFYLLVICIRNVN